MFVLFALIALLILFILLVLIQTLTPTTSITLFTLLASLTLVASIMILLIFDLYSDDEDEDIPLGKTKEGVMVYYVSEKRQCVEFIRRYLTATKGLTFPSVRDANELLNLTTLSDVKNDSKTYKTSFYKQPNVPREGDIIFMNISKWGHVGVVVNVFKDNNDDIIVDIISQNSKDQIWHNNKNNNDNYDYTERMFLKDPLILGWWRVDENAL